MKKLLIVLAVFVTVSVFAQAPQKMSYQAVIRNSSSALITSTTVGMQISILQGSAIGTPVYVEIQTPTSNINGLVSLEIGTGITVDDFSTIDWSNGPYFIKTETDPTGGSNYTIIGTSELLSVPYALHAKTAETVTGGINEADPIFGASVASGIIGTDTTYWNNKLDNYTETDPIFGASVASGITGIDTTYWNNKLDTEIDGSVTNELQVLSISNDTIYLSDGGFVKIPSANAWSLNGNTGTVDGTNWIGTNDNVPLNLKVNNQKAGRIDQYLFNSFYGYQAGNSNTTGVNNTASGYQSLFLNTTGHENVSVGNYSLYENTIGTANTALGYAAMNKNTSGGANTAIGYDALFYNTTGNENTAMGRVALHFNTTGVWNTANGSVALMNNTTGNNNTSVGYGSLFTNTTGNNNTAIGWNAGNLNETGSGNVFLGYQAGLNETGSNKLYIANNSTNPPLIYGDFATGNIGLGNNNPSARLHIGSGTRFVASSDASIFLQSGDGVGSSRDWKIYVPMTAGYLAFRDMGFDNLNNGMATDAMAIQYGTGNIGIGTTNPSAKLEVQGAVKIVDGTQSIGKVLTSDANGLASWQAANSYTAGSGIEINGNVIKTNEPFYLGQDTLGGIVYYIYKGSDGQQHGLIVSKTVTTAQWQSTVSATNATRSWDGAYNMNLMTNSPAKTWVTGLGPEWYLPSYDELNILWNNRFHANKGLNDAGATLFSDLVIYWTSTEFDATSAYRYPFYWGHTTFPAKTTTYTVRAVRAF